MNGTLEHAYCKGAIQDTSQEGNAATPSCLVIEVFPYKRVARMLSRHGSNHNDCYQTANNNEESADMLQSWHEAVAENNERSAAPSNEDKRNVNVPWPDDEVGMKYGVHLNGHVRDDLNDRSKVENPASKIDKPGEETEHAA